MSNSSDAKKFSSAFVPFFLALKLEVLKFEFCQVKNKNTYKHAINWQNFTGVGLKLAFRIRS